MFERKRVILPVRQSYIHGGRLPESGLLNDR